MEGVRNGNMNRCFIYGLNLDVGLHTSRFKVMMCCFAIFTDIGISNNRNVTQFPQSLTTTSFMLLTICLNKAMVD